MPVDVLWNPKHVLVYHDISDSHRVLVKNQTRFDIVDSVHVQVHERELWMPAVLAGERARLSPVAAGAAGPAPAPCMLHLRQSQHPLSLWWLLHQLYALLQHWSVIR